MPSDNPAAQRNQAGTDLPTRWDSERQYFDQLAKSAPPFDLERVSRRYESAMGSPLHPLEVAYSLLGNLSGKRILDIGCGMGENSLLFARWGARVVGVDISAQCIDVAKMRAVKLHVADKVTFVRSPFEVIGADYSPFDIVWSAAFLHHVLDRLHDVCGIMHDLVDQKGFVLFLEPVRLSSLIKALRSIVPVRRHGTPDERPLEMSDIQVIESRFSLESQTVFGPVSRLNRVVLDGDYESAGEIRRALCDGLYRIDKKLMERAACNTLAMIMVAKMRPRASGC